MTKLTGRLNIEGNVKDTKKKIHWVGSSAFVLENISLYHVYIYISYIYIYILLGGGFIFFLEFHPYLGR